MQITNLNPADDIGASGWFLQIEGYRLLMDAGVHPKLEGRKALPLYDLTGDQEADAIAITHCHHDHVGSLPVALRRFPRAHVLMSELSYLLVERVLHNSVNVMCHQRDELGIQDYPFYTHGEVDDMAHLFQGYPYNREIEWGAYRKLRSNPNSPTLEFYDAGHALGSAGLMVRGARETLFYSGDVCFRDQTILKGARFEDVQADVVVLETTRGSRKIAPGFSREKEIQRLTKSIHSVFERKGSVLIPTFALGRTQEVLALLALLMREKSLKPRPIYIGGLGRVFTEIYDIEAHRTHRQHSNLRLHDTLNLIVLDRKQQEKIRMKGGRLFVLTAGMMTENTAAHDIAVRLAGEEKHGIFFVGYSDPKTPAGRMRQVRRGDTFLFSPSAGEITLNCEVQEFDLTAHANREDLLEFVGQVSPRVVVLGHGEPEARNWMEDQIRGRFPGVEVLQPGPGETVEIS